MDIQEQLILINGTDKSDAIESFALNGSKCNITYKNSPKVYAYNSSHVRVLQLQKEIELDSVIVAVNGENISHAERLLDYGDYYKIIFEKYSRVYPREEVQLRENCLSQKACADRFDYFKQIAGAISLVAGDGFNILGHQYEKIQSVSEETVLASYLAERPTVQERTPPDLLLYPFGLNQSQKRAVEHAFSSQISIIQGPPGTGKTQTILNIIANAVANKQTVAVVSNNNSATHNVVEKLEKKQLNFLTAFLGSRANKMDFLSAQSGSYPDMKTWKIPKEELPKIQEHVKNLTEEINQRLNDKNRIAEIEQELLALDPESRYFEEYYQNCHSGDHAMELGLSSEKAVALWNEYEEFVRENKKVGVFSKIRIWFQYNRKALKLFAMAPDAVIPYLQKQFYLIKSAELHQEREQLERNLEHYNFEEKAQELSEQSMQLFRHILAKRYREDRPRPRFESQAFYRDCEKFNQEYPVVLSTTYSIKNSLSVGHIYDYLIVDESSQVDLATGALALSCARNVVIVGDLKQLPNVLTDADKKTADAFWDDSLGENYRFTKHSLLSSAIDVWQDAPSVLLREHYRCHPKIINFCNQKFYDGQLIVMTQDHGETDALSLYHTTAGSHARGRVNQRQVDVISNEVLPKLYASGYADIGIITPYRDQVNTLKKQLPSQLEIDTVHKFQGREKDAIVLTSVDDVITDFVDDDHMLNVAVSRAVKSLVVVTSNHIRNDHTNYGDLARYIAYNNFEVVDSKIYSVFDLLYKEYAQQRQAFLKKHKRVSEYDSENLLYGILEEILHQPAFQKLDCAVHVSLATLIKEYSGLTADEEKYARNPLTHTDFLLFNKMDKAPVLAIEVDGTRFHQEGSKQAERDEKKDHVFAVCGIPLLRLRTDTSGEREKIESALKQALLK